jgi:hypothetical protein
MVLGRVMPHGFGSAGRPDGLAKKQAFIYPMSESDGIDLQKVLDEVRIRLESARKSVSELEIKEAELMKKIGDSSPNQTEMQRGKDNSESQRKRGRKQKVEQDGRVSSCSFEESAWDPRFILVKQLNGLSRVIVMYFFAEMLCQV